VGSSHEDTDNLEDNSLRSKGRLLLNNHTIDHSPNNNKGYILKDTFQADRPKVAQVDMRDDNQDMELKGLVLVYKT